MDERSLILSILLFLVVLGSNSKESGADSNKIPIAMSLDDGYVYPTIVSITSAMLNSPPELEYEFYLMHPGEFSSGAKEKLLSLTERFPNCHLVFLNMEDAFKTANDAGHVSTPTYYRLSLPDLLPDVEKLLWLDGDTLILGDLSEMYRLPMNGLHFRGFLDSDAYRGYSFGGSSDHYICGGVMVMNLAELRRDNATQKFAEFVAAHNSELVQHDQSVINAVSAAKIGVLPPRFGVFNFWSKKHEKQYLSQLLSPNKYTLAELDAAVANPVVLHFTDKPWGLIKMPRTELWWEYAAKTDFFEEICEKYSFLNNLKDLARRGIKGINKLLAKI